MKEIGLSFDLGNRSWMHRKVRPDTKEVHETKFLPRGEWSSTEELVDHIRELAIGIKNPHWEFENDFDEVNLFVAGWRPMNDKELKQFPALYGEYLDRIKKETERQKETRHAQYLNLKKEFGNETS